MEVAKSFTQLIKQAKAEEENGEMETARELYEKAIKQKTFTGAPVQQANGDVPKRKRIRQGIKSYKQSA